MKVSKGVIVLVSSLMLLGLACGYQLENGGKIWALLVAGSNGYDNYRHQVYDAGYCEVHKWFQHFRLSVLEIKLYLNCEF
jgi:glycosylphosphatidylinositol transamidase (GPIT) subunit GPI8